MNHPGVPQIICLQYGRLGQQLKIELLSVTAQLKGNLFKINTAGKPKISYSVRVCAVGIKAKMSSRLLLPQTLTEQVSRM